MCPMLHHKLLQCMDGRDSFIRKVVRVLTTIKVADRFHHFEDCVRRSLFLRRKFPIIAFLSFGLA